MFSKESVGIMFPRPISYEGLLWVVEETFTSKDLNIKNLEDNHVDTFNECISQAIKSLSLSQQVDMLVEQSSTTNTVNNNLSIEENITSTLHGMVYYSLSGLTTSDIILFRDIRSSLISEGAWTVELFFESINYQSIDVIFKIKEAWDNVLKALDWKVLFCASMFEVKDSGNSSLLIHPVDNLFGSTVYAHFELPTAKKVCSEFNDVYTYSVNDCLPVYRVFLQKAETALMSSLDEDIVQFYRKDDQKT